jgi:hypothetical protein
MGARPETSPVLRVLEVGTKAGYWSATRMPSPPTDEELTALNM